MTFRFRTASESLFRNAIWRALLLCLVTWVVAGGMVSTSTAQSVSPLEQKLFDLPDLRFQRVEDHEGFPAYLMNIRQPIDHENPEAGHFYQQVYLIHRGFDRPMVLNTDGYALTRRPSELFANLEANYLSVEHRFFGPSTPDGKPWEHLTIQQAAADYHHLHELMKTIYEQSWVSTGISKGGETCTYYKYYYPNDVAVSVPYVAPFPDELKDPRIYKFLEQAGTPECREKIRQFQRNVLKHKAELLPLFEYYLKGKNAKVELIGGPEAALELFVLEYPFSFWQSGKSEESIPPADAAPRALLDHIVDSGDFWYLLDGETESLAAHYYQHATQYGYYGYQTEPFDDLIDKWSGEPSACFFPYSPDLPYDPSIRDNLMEWLQRDARDIVFIYGGTDTWTACQADLGDNSAVRKFILPGKHHYNARISQADKAVQAEILDWIRARL